MYHYRNFVLRTKIRKEVFIFFVLSAVLTMIAVGTIADEEVTPEIKKAVTIEQPVLLEHQVTDANDGAIQSFTFNKDAPITDALRVLAAKYRTNIVPSSKVDGLLTITSLRNVSLEQALDAVLGENYVYGQKDYGIEVYPKGDTSRMDYGVFTLNYISASEAKKLIMPILSESGDIDSTTAAQTGVPVGESISSQTGGGDTVSLQDTIVVYDFAENIAKAEKIIKAVDVKPKQVLIETTILSATLTENMEFGIDWKTLHETAIDELSDITRNSRTFLGSAGLSQVDATGGLSVGLVQGSIGAFIRAVEAVTDVTILANPKILAVNKQLGQVYIGKKIGYLSQTTQTSESTTEEVAFLDTGTKLSFRPYIGEDGNIRMDIHSKDSSGEFNAQNLPDETSAELVTNIMVKDGQTIVIGGMFRDKLTANRTQVPLLGDLPLIGNLFRGTSDTTSRQEVIVMLTPHIIDEPAQTEGLARAEDASRTRDGAKNAFHELSRSKRAEDNYIKAAQSYLAGDAKAATKQLDLALELRPTYLEAIRLKERIISETDPDNPAAIERKMRAIVEEKDTTNWLRR